MPKPTPVLVRAVEDVVVAFLGALVALLGSSQWDWSHATDAHSWAKISVAAGAVALPAIRSALSLLLSSGQSSGIVQTVKLVRQAVATPSVTLDGKRIATSLASAPEFQALLNPPDGGVVQTPPAEPSP